MEYKGEFTIEDFEELIKEQEMQSNIPRKRQFMRFWPTTEEEEKMLKKAGRAAFFLDEI